MRVLLRLVMCLGAALLWVGPLSGQSLEHQVRAAFIVNFARFVEWPPAQLPREHGSFVVGVMGAPPVAEALRVLARAGTVRGFPLEVTEVPEGATFAGQILYLGAGARRGHAAKVAGRPGLLIVGEQTDGPLSEVMLSFLLKDRTVKFAAWPERARAAGLKLGARLLQVSVAVEGGAGK